MSVQRQDEEALFHAARQISSAEARADYLAKACQGDQALRSHLESLLKVYDSQSRFLETNVGPLVDTSPILAAPVPAAPRPAAVGLEQFKRSLAECGLMSDEVVRQFVEALPADKRPRDSESLAHELVQAGKLTRFQALNLCQGKGKHLVLGEYIVLDKIGAGGMGQVFKAQHRRMQRIVAIKVLPPAMMKSPDVVKRFEREVQAAARLTHPNIVTAHDAGHSGGVHFLVMEYVDGRDLSSMMKQGPLPLDKALDYIQQAARGLAYAHGEGMVHRDIKPANLLLDNKGVVKILDMGLARFDNTPKDEGLTNSGTVMGTVDYMAPEQALNTHNADARADIYSLGCSLYRLLTGQAVYPGETAIEKIMAHKDKPIPSLRAIRKDMPAALDNVLVRMLAKKPEDRYQTMHEVIGELEKVQRGGVGVQRSEERSQKSEGRSQQAEVSTASADSPSPASRFRTGLIAAGLIGLIGVVAGIVVKVQTKDGTLIVEVNQPGAEIEVLNEQNEVQITQPGVQGKITIGVAPGKHRLRVEKDGFKLFADDFEIESGKETSIKATLLPLEQVKPRVVAKVEPAPKPVEPTQQLPTPVPTPTPVASSTPMPTPAPVATTPATAANTPGLTPTARPGESPPLAIAPFNAQQAKAHQQAWASHLGTQVETTNSIGMKMVVIPPGEFVMGASQQEYDEAIKGLDPVKNSQDQVKINECRAELPQHTVTLSRPFWLGATEVTVGQFRKFVNDTKYKTDAERDGQGGWPPGGKSLVPGIIWSKPGYTQTDDYPVVQVSWNDAVEFCNWLSQQERVSPVYVDKDGDQNWAIRPGDGYRLPTEAEWEFTCRAGTTGAYFCGLQELDKYAWLADKAPHPVATKQPNPFGLFDVQGNVRQWVHDWYDAGYYANAPRLDPAGPAVGQEKRRVFRGAGWFFSAVYCRSSVRAHNGPSNRNCWIGFRIARGLDVGAARLAAAPVNSSPPAVSTPKLVSPPPKTTVGNLPPRAKAPFDAAQARAHQEAWAAQLNTTVEVPHPLGFKLILIPPGEFVMGASQQEYEEAIKGLDPVKNPQDQVRINERRAELPQHTVILSRPFWLGATEVTVGQFRKFVDDTKYKTDAERSGQGGWLPGGTSAVPGIIWTNPGHAQTDDCPVVQVSWNDAVEFCNWLSQQERVSPVYVDMDGNRNWGIMPGNGYRMPTEAEWEFTCRAGTTGAYFCGSKELATYDWIDDKLSQAPHPVATKQPNPFGLFDTQGNVREWVHDWYDAGYYANAPRLDPAGPVVGQEKRRVLRGGAWIYSAMQCRSSVRVQTAPTTRASYIGFRIARGLDVGAARPATAARSTPTVAPAVTPSGANLFVGERRPQGPKTPVPDSTSQQTALELVKQVFPAEYAKTGRPEDKRALAEKLLAQVVKTPDDAAARYVLACEARDLAVDLADLPLLEQAANFLGSEFDLDQHLMLAEIYQKLLTRSRPVEANRALAESAIKVLDDAVASGRLEAAEKLAKVAISAAGKVRDAQLTKTAKAKSEELASVKHAWDAAEQATAKLVESPDDTDAHMALGRYLCFHRGEWDEGLKHLSSGSDATLKDLAAKSLSHPANAASLAELGDLWWNAAEKAKGKDKAPFQAGAQHWYALALPALSGLNRVKVEKRLADLGEPVVASKLPIVSNAAPADAPSTKRTLGNAPPLAKAPFDEQQAVFLQRAWARHLRASVETTNSVGAKMILIPPGEFLMGSSDEQIAEALKVAEEATKFAIPAIPYERPQHRVILTKPFWMAATETTVRQFKQFAAATGYKTEAEQAEITEKTAQLTYLNPGHSVTDESPAAVITWNDAVAYCKWLSDTEKVTYRLPTEAEWEYSCRSGTTTHFSFGDDVNQLELFGWYVKNAGGKSNPVKTKPPNAFGLHDMHGNLWEWCQDFWDEKSYEKTSLNDPNGPAIGSSRVARGGHWAGGPSYSRATFRYSGGPKYRSVHFGFRCVREQ